MYRRRPDIGGICRVLPPAVIALSALGETPRALHGPGSYFAPQPPLWPDVQLIRDDPRAGAVADLLKDAAAIVMRGNGAVTVGSSLEEALTFAVYLEDAARLELALLPATAAGRPVLEFSADDAAKRAIRSGDLVKRMWQYLCFGDPEWDNLT